MFLVRASPLLRPILAAAALALPYWSAPTVAVALRLTFAAAPEPQSMQRPGGAHTAPPGGNDEDLLAELEAMMCDISVNETISQEASPDDAPHDTQKSAPAAQPHQQQPQAVEETIDRRLENLSAREVRRHEREASAQAKADAKAQKLFERGAASSSRSQSRLEKKEARAGRLNEQKRVRKVDRARRKGPLRGDDEGGTGGKRLISRCCGAVFRKMQK